MQRCCIIGECSTIRLCPLLVEILNRVQVIRAKVLEAGGTCSTKDFRSIVKEAIGKSNADNRMAAINWMFDNPKWKSDLLRRKQEAEEEKML